MKVIAKILQYFRGNRTHETLEDWNPPPRDEGDFPDKGKIDDEAASILFFIDCPCQCGRAIRMALTPAKPDKDYDIPEIGNKFWQQLVDENGLEAAIEYLHDNA